MGTSGVPFNPDKQALIAAIKKYRGIKTHICDGIGIHHSTLTKYVNQHEDIKKIMDEERNAFDERLCDTGEHVLLKSMEQEEDKSCALKAAMFALNNKARQRGYSVVATPPASEPSSYTIKIVEKMDNLNGTDSVSKAIDELSRSDG